MAARPRIRKRANWPANLHEPREGYYTFRDPRNGKLHVLGRIPLAQAIFEAHEANAAIAAAPRRSLVEQISAPVETVADLLDKMPYDGISQSTRKTWLTLDKTIRAAIGDVPCHELTTKQCAAVLLPYKDAGKARMAQSLRSRLIAMCTEGMGLGWMDKNPASATKRVDVTVKRRRLTLDEFQRIYERAPEVSAWLQNAMLLALVSGQDRSTIRNWLFSYTQGDAVILQRSKTAKKTGLRIAIPLQLRLNAMNVTLGDVIARCRSTGVVTKYLIHHIRPQGDAKRGDPIRLTSISQAFAKARTLAGIGGEDAPSFHEIRSLCKRTYLEQGLVDTKTLLGHTSDEMAALYANSRGLSPVRVQIDAA